MKLSLFLWSMLVLLISISILAFCSDNPATAFFAQYLITIVLIGIEFWIGERSGAKSLWCIVTGVDLFMLAYLAVAAGLIGTFFSFCTVSIFMGIVLYPHIAARILKVDFLSFFSKMIKNKT
jgi:hypothetical protein